MSRNKVRVLCLHGGGSSNQIMQMQTAAIRYELENEATFEFVEGAFPSPSYEALSGTPSSIKVDQVVAPSQQKFFAYYDPRDAASLQSTQTEILGLLGEMPFDVVLAFSEGAALAASLMVRHTVDNPLADPLFSGAIFISGIPPLRVSDEEPRLRRYERKLDGVVIHAPTLHVIGTADPWRPSNESLWELCDTKLAIRITHPGGHEIPKNPQSITQEIVQGIRDTVAKTRLRQ